MIKEIEKSERYEVAPRAVEEKELEKIISRMDNLASSLEQKTERLAYIEDKLQGPKSQTDTEEIDKPSNDYLSRFNHITNRLNKIDDNIGELLSNIETIV